MDSNIPLFTDISKKNKVMRYNSKKKSKKIKSNNNTLYTGDYFYTEES